MNFQRSNVFDKVGKGNYNGRIIDANGCTDNKNVVVAVNDNLSLDAENQIMLCEGGSAQLNISSNGAGFTWYPQNNINNGGIQSPVVSPRQTTTYFVTAVLSVCEKKDSVLVLVNPAPIAAAEKDTVICFGQSVRLVGTGGMAYHWSPATSLSDPSSPTPTVITPTSSTSYFLDVKDDKGCSSLNNATVKVSVTAPAKLFAGNDTAIVMNQPFQLKALDVNNSGFVSYSWMPSDGLNNSLIPNPVATLGHDITYKVVATTSAGCEGTDEISVKVYLGPDIFVPTAFSPNYDGLNDQLKPIPIGIRQFKYFIVYNRYGQKVFYSTDKHDGWDGTFRNILQQTGVFVWMAEGIDDKGRTLVKKGTTTLIR